MSKKTSSDLPVQSSPPTECPTPPENGGAILAKEMNRLSVEEREKVLADIHGISPDIDEPQEFIEERLALLEKELTNIPSKAAYDLASSLSKEYTSSNKIRLMLLRAESFDPYKAASRMVGFFAEKYELFGADKIAKDIALIDLDPDDISALEKGFSQVLPEKDSAGRKVFCFFRQLRAAQTTQSVLRAFYYTVMSNVEDDEEAQKRGIVGCAYVVGGDLQSIFDLQLLQKIGKLADTLPARINSIHLCYNEPKMFAVFSLAIYVMSRHCHARFRAHYGSDEECQCQLSSFGIPISALPVSSRGEVNLENQRTFMAMQRASEAIKSKRKESLCVPQKAKKTPKALSRQPITTREDVFVAAPRPNEPNINEQPTGPASATSRPAKPYVICDPLPNDILLGRGKPIQYRPANVRFRKMLDSHIEKYGKGENGGRAVFSTYITHLVKEEGGRFIKQQEDGGGWVEVDEATARAKVSQAFRTRIRVFQEAATTLKKDKSTA